MPRITCAASPAVFKDNDDVQRCAAAPGGLGAPSWRRHSGRALQPCSPRLSSGRHSRAVTLLWMAGLALKRADGLSVVSPHARHTGRQVCASTPLRHPQVAFPFAREAR
jgi:hypothetical protein